jgi:uncharacterized repeat protein (TIGR01451 family)
MKTRIGYKAIALMTVVALMASVVGAVATAQPAYASPKSLYVISSHTTKAFDAYAIAANGTITYQATHNLVHISAPGGVAMDEDSVHLFVTGEFQNRVEMVDATTITSLGYVVAPGASNLAGIEVDDANDIVYTVDRSTANLYAFDWDPIAGNLTQRAGFPKVLAGCTAAWGLALDEIAGILYVADSLAPGGGAIRGYDVNTWANVQNFFPSQPPVGIAVDRLRGFLVSTAPDGTCAGGGGTPQGNNVVVKIDIATGVETTSPPLGHGTMGIAVDEVSGYVYVTGGCTGDTLEVWDTSPNPAAPWIQVDSTGDIGNPAGICIPQTEVAYNPLHLTKDDGLGAACVNPGDNISYSICYDNTANNFPVSNVILVDDLPPEVSFVSASVNGTYDAMNHRVTWNIGSLPAGYPGGCEQLVVQVNAGTAPGTIITNSCTIDSDTTPPTTVTEQTTVCGPPPQVPGMTGWGIIATAIMLAVLIPLTLRRRVFANMSG